MSHFTQEVQMPIYIRYKEQQGLLAIEYFDDINGQSDVILDRHMVWNTVTSW